MTTNYKYHHLPELEGNYTRQNIVVFSGAGMSAESGLSTFRDKNGLWKQYDWEKLASIEGFREDPQAVLDFYNMRRRRLLEVEPNHAHYLIAELEKWHDVTIITQNVDDLHERAGSSDVLHLHGELKKVTSSLNPLSMKCIKEMPLDVPIRLGDKASDGSQLRPFIVWFGEYVDNFSSAADLVRKADIFVVIGTSLTVHPAAGLIHYAHREIPKFIINPGDVDCPEGYTHIKEDATKGIETFIDWILKELVDEHHSYPIPKRPNLPLEEIEIPEWYREKYGSDIPIERMKGKCEIEISDNKLFY